MSIATAIKALTKTDTSDEIERLEQSAAALAAALTGAGVDQLGSMRSLQAAERAGDVKASNIAQGLIAEADSKIAALRVRAAAVKAALAESRAQLAVEQKGDKTAEAQAAILQTGAACEAAAHAATVSMLDLSKALRAYSDAATAERAAKDSLARVSGDYIVPFVGLRGLGAIEKAAKVSAGTMKTVSVEIPA